MREWKLLHEEHCYLARPEQLPRSPHRNVAYGRTILQRRDLSASELVSETMHRHDQARLLRVRLDLLA